MTWRSFRFWLFSLVLWVACQSEIQRPHADAGLDLNDVAVGTAVQLDGSNSTDPQQKTLTFAWRFSALPAGTKARLVGADGPKPSFTPDMSGTYRVELIVANGTSASEPSTVTVNVGKCGANLPVIDSVDAKPNAMVNMGDTVSLSAKVSHADETGTCNQKRKESFSWKITKSPNGSAAPILGPTTEGPSFVPDKEGDYEITLTVTDDLGHVSLPKAVTFHAGKCGSQTPSVMSITPTPNAPNMGDVVQLGAVVTDPDTDMGCGKTESFAYAWQILSLPSGSLASLNLVSAQNPSFTPDVAGSYLIGLSVTDSAGHKSAVTTAKIDVQPCGLNAPVISQLNVLPSAAPNTNQIVTLTAQVDDADTKGTCTVVETFSYQWSLVGVPPQSTATLTSTTEASPSITPDQPGDYFVNLVVSDTKGHLSPMKQVTFKAAACGSAKPVASLAELTPNASAAGPQIVGNPVALGSTVQLTAASSSDSDIGGACNSGQTLSYSWFFIEQPSTTNNNQTSFNDATILNPSFSPNEAGKYVIGLVVTDSTGLQSGTATFTLTADPAVNVNPMNGFTITSLVAGAAQGVRGPRGITKDGAGGIYWANNNNSRVRKLANSQVTNFAAGGLLNNPNDITYDAAGNQFFVNASNNQIITISAAGVQANCINNQPYNNLQMYTTANNTVRLLAAFRTNVGCAGVTCSPQRHLELINPTNCTVDKTTDFAGGAGNVIGQIQGVTGVTRMVAAVLVDDVFEVDRETGELWRNETANVLLANNQAPLNTMLTNNLQGARDVVVSPPACAGINNHPKLFVAERGAGRLTIVNNAGGSGRTTVANGFNGIWGLFFEDQNNLLITDENFNAVMRLTGNFCNL